MNFRLVDVSSRRGRFDGVRAERETRRNLTAALSAWLGDQSDYVKRLVKSSLIDGAVGNLRTLRILLARYFDEQTEQGLPESVTRAVKAVSDAALDTVLDDTEPEENARIDESWVAGFDERYDRKMAARLNKANPGAVVRALGELGDKDHVKAALTGLDAWPDNRAVKMAQTEIVMATNEAKVAGYRACGYESVWQSTPSCCKICQRYNNETVTALKPPLHKGCTCGVAKGSKRVLTDDDNNATIPYTVSDERWKTADFRDEAALQRHLDKHLSDYPGYTKEDYIASARELLSADLSDDIDGFISRDNWVFKYRISTNDFALGHPKGTISTYMKPKEGYMYWVEQIAKYKSEGG